MKNSKFFVRLICVVLCVIMVGGLLTSAMLSILANRPVEEEHDHAHEETVQMVTLP